MNLPIRFVVCTYNLWSDERWPERKEPLKRFLSYHLPDILCVQELRPVTRDLIDAVLEFHRRVDDPFRGWSHEGNIYWNTAMFELDRYGTEDIGMFEELRRLFWVKLRFRDQERALWVATAHYTWSGTDREMDTGVNPRIAQARKTVEALDRLVPPSEALLFMGDLNDFLHPLRILRQGALRDSFSALGRLPSPTWPALPIAQGPPELDDWILHRGPIHPMTSSVVDFYVGDFPPSDHKPLMATWRV